MSDRLAELVRQRALLQEHLAWLDREIARESPAAGGAATSPRPHSASDVKIAPRAAAVPDATSDLRSAPPATPAEIPDRAADVEAILDRYRTPAATLQSDVRKGCFLYFAAALLLLGLLVTALYFTLRHR